MNSNLIFAEIGWDKTVDHWSIGCILFELYTGDQLFQVGRGSGEVGEKDREHLAMIEARIRRIPYAMGWNSKTDYFRRGSLIWEKEKRWKKLEVGKRS